jgi:poly-gamma-glutamate capsule biosynthesis protein CapA/YwtB (metallophosphatase superfamily)
VIRTSRPVIRARASAVLGAAVLAAAATAGCSGSAQPTAAHTRSTSTGGRSATASDRPATPVVAPGGSEVPAPGSAAPRGQFTVSFAGDVHFSGRVRKRLAHPATAFGAAARVLRRADLTLVNLETAITRGGVAQPKEYHFRTPPVALTALRDAGIDVATEANNHGADYGLPGLRDTLHAIRRSHFPVIGIGRDADQAFAPYRTTLNGTKVAIFAADQVQDETTLSRFSAGPHSPGVANAYYPRLVRAVARAHRRGYVVIAYIHWGIEYDTCPSSDQTALAGNLARAGAAAVIGTHAHVLQGDGWRKNGTFVAYGLGNYLWWESFGNIQDDNGVLTLTFRHGTVVGDRFSPAHLDSRGVPMPAHGAQRRRILGQLVHDRSCTGLSAAPR